MSTKQEDHVIIEPCTTVPERPYSGQYPPYTPASTVIQAEIPESDEALLILKSKNPVLEREKAEKLWELWQKTEPENKPCGQAAELLRNL